MRGQTCCLANRIQRQSYAATSLPLFTYSRDFAPSSRPDECCHLVLFQSLPVTTAFVFPVERRNHQLLLRFHIIGSLEETVLRLRRELDSYVGERLIVVGMDHES